MEVTHSQKDSQLEVVDRLEIVEEAIKVQKKRTAGTGDSVCSDSLKSDMRGVFYLLSPGKEFRPVSASGSKQKSRR